MKTIKRIITAVIVCMMLVCNIPFSVSADDANVTYSGNSGNLIFEPGSEYSPTDLFANFKNVMPGASLTQKITLKNNADNKVKVKIYLRSLGSTDEKYNDFLDQLTLTVTKANETPMFDAEADKTAGLTDWVCLGTLYSGGTVDINVTLDVPTTLDNMYQNQIGKIRWQFLAEEFEIIEQPEWEHAKEEDHKYHIDDDDGEAKYVCEDCSKAEIVHCDVCGDKMRVIYIVVVGGNTYEIFLEDENNFTTKDHRARFHFNDEGILEYYIVDGKKTDVSDISKYQFYYYLECFSEEHHTDPRPVPPKTGDDSNLYLWLTVSASSCVLLVIIIVCYRKKKNKRK